MSGSNDSDILDIIEDENLDKSYSKLKNAKNNLINENIDEDVVNNFACDICGCLNRDATDLSDHKMIYHDNAFGEIVNFMCKNCNKQFLNEDDLYDHLDENICNNYQIKNDKLKDDNLIDDLLIKDKLIDDKIENKLHIVEKAIEKISDDTKKNKLLENIDRTRKKLNLFKKLDNNNSKKNINDTVANRKINNVKQNFNENIYKCPVCNNILSDYYNLNDHFIRYHSSYESQLILDSKKPEGGFPGFTILKFIGMLTELDMKEYINIYNDCCMICTDSYCDNLEFHINNKINIKTLKYPVTRDLPLENKIINFKQNLNNSNVEKNNKINNNNYEDNENDHEDHEDCNDVQNKNNDYDDDYDDEYCNDIQNKNNMIINKENHDEDDDDDDEDDDDDYDDEDDEDCIDIQNKNNVIIDKENHEDDDDELPRLEDISVKQNNNDIQEDNDKQFVKQINHKEFSFEENKENRVNYENTVRHNKYVNIGTCCDLELENIRKREYNKKINKYSKCDINLYTDNNINLTDKLLRGVYSWYCKEKKRVFKLNCCNVIICGECLEKYIKEKNDIICPFCKHDHNKRDESYIKYTVFESTNKTEWMNWWNKHIDILEKDLFI